VNTVLGHSLSACIKCPNTVFGKTDDERPCLQRCLDFPKLDFVKTGNNANLTDFWLLVESLLDSKSNEEIQEMGTQLQTEIHTIARLF
jgi:hypothetical protein